LAEKYGAFFDKKRFIVTAVPISKSRKKWRGFDQSREVAKILAKKFNLEYMDTLGKKETKPQVGLKRVERIKNIQNNIFITDKELNLGGSRVVMIDDVYTSGSTLEECAKILRQAGAREVWGMVLSRD
jgi:ComF family protein